MRECDRQEKRVCKGLKGRRQVGSGSTPFLKGDGVLDDLLIECKTKDKVSKSMVIKKDWFDKSKEEAFCMNKEGAILVFSYGDGIDYVAEDFDSFKNHYEGFRKSLEIKRIIDINKNLNGLEELRTVIDLIEDILNK